MAKTDLIRILGVLLLAVGALDIAFGLGAPIFMRSKQSWIIRGAGLAIGLIALAFGAALFLGYVQPS